MGLPSANIWNELAPLPKGSLVVNGYYEGYPTQRVSKGYLIKTAQVPENTQYREQLAYYMLENEDSLYTEQIFNQTYFYYIRAVDDIDRRWPLLSPPLLTNLEQLPEIHGVYRSLPIISSDPVNCIGNSLSNGIEVNSVFEQIIPVTEKIIDYYGVGEIDPSFIINWNSGATQKHFYNYFTGNQDIVVQGGIVPGGSAIDNNNYDYQTVATRQLGVPAGVNFRFYTLAVELEYAVSGEPGAASPEQSPILRYKTRNNTTNKETILGHYRLWPDIRTDYNEGIWFVTQLSIDIPPGELETFTLDIKLPEPPTPQTETIIGASTRKRQGSSTTTLPLLNQFRRRWVYWEYDSPQIINTNFTNTTSEVRVKLVQVLIDFPELFQGDANPNGWAYYVSIRFEHDSNSDVRLKPEWESSNNCFEIGSIQLSNPTYRKVSDSEFDYTFSFSERNPYVSNYTTPEPSLDIIYYGIRKIIHLFDSQPSLTQNWSTFNSLAKLIDGTPYQTGLGINFPVTFTINDLPNRPVRINSMRQGFGSSVWAFKWTDKAPVLAPVQQHRLAIATRNLDQEPQELPICGRDSLVPQGSTVRDNFLLNLPDNWTVSQGFQETFTTDPVFIATSILQRMGVQQQEIDWPSAISKSNTVTEPAGFIIDENFKLSDLPVIPIFSNGKWRFPNTDEITITSSQVQGNYSISRIAPEVGPRNVGFRTLSGRWTTIERAENPDKTITLPLQNNYQDGLKLARETLWPEEIVTITATVDKSKILTIGSRVVMQPLPHPKNTYKWRVESIRDIDVQTVEIIATWINENRNTYIATGNISTVLPLLFDDIPGDIDDQTLQWDEMTV